MNIQKYTYLLLLVTVFVSVSCKPQYKSSKTNQKSIKQHIHRVKAQKLQPSRKSFPLKTSGVLASKKVVKLAFNAGGSIRSLRFNAGDFVKKGQLLAELNPSKINAQLTQATSQLKKAKRSLSRIRGLYNDSSATLEQLQNKKTSYMMAKSKLRIARYHKKYSQIRAPSDGRILKKFAETNEIVSPGQPIYRFGRDGGKQFMLKVGLTDRQVIRVNRGDSATVELEVLPNHCISGSVYKIAAVPDDATGLFEVKISLKTSSSSLRDGFFGNATIYPAQTRAYFKIPMAALVAADTNHISFFVVNGPSSPASLKKLKPFYIGTNFFAVSEKHVAHGKWVVTRGINHLHDGDNVNIINQN